jgi:hypothetical protein
MNLSYFYLVSFFTVILAIMMKLLSFKVSHCRVSFSSFFKSPLLIANYKWIDRSLHMLVAEQIGLLTLIFLHLFLLNFFHLKIHHPLLFPYLASPLIYFSTLWIGCSLQLMWKIFTQTPTSIHRKPYLSRNLNEFWSLRWNVWIREWIRSLTKKQNTRSSTKKRLFINFLVSGLLHEIMFNLPYEYSHGHAPWGNMTLYFLIQALGIFIDKTYFKNAKPLIRVFWCWLFVIGFIPLFVQKPFLTIFGLN